MNKIAKLYINWGWFNHILENSVIYQHLKIDHSMIKKQNLFNLLFEEKIFKII